MPPFFDDVVTSLKLQVTIDAGTDH